MDALAAIDSAAAMRNSLEALLTGYEAWIAEQKGKLPSDSRRREIGEELLNRARQAKDRIAAGIACLSDPNVLDAFRLMNRVMATVIRKRRAMAELPDENPVWRPFQLAFILMNLRGIADPLHPDRSVVDLLFFPTGGGKTEAYLGLAAFTLVLRRLKNPGLASAGRERADALYAAAADAGAAKPRGDSDLRPGTGAPARYRAAGPVAVRDRAVGGDGGDAQRDGPQGRQQ